jgi:hypothetical protein
MELLLWPNIGKRLRLRWPSTRRQCHRWDDFLSWSWRVRSCGAVLQGPGKEYVSKPDARTFELLVLTSLHAGVVVGTQFQIRPSTFTLPNSFRKSRIQEENQTDLASCRFSNCRLRCTREGKKRIGCRSAASIARLALDRRDPHLRRRGTSLRFSGILPTTWAIAGTRSRGGGD